MKNIIFLLFPVILISCSNKKDQTMKLGVDQTIKIPVEYVEISTGILERGQEVTKVEKEGYKKLAAVVEVLKKFGYDKKQLEINSGEVSNRSYGDKPVEFSSSIKFDLNQLEKIDTFRRSLSNVGATRFRISSYNNSKEDSIYDAAYQEAINNAKRKAQKLLANQGLEVGKIANLLENVEETIEVSATSQMAAPPPLKESDSNLETVDPLFNKEFYTRNIEFNIEFELEEK